MEKNQHTPCAFAVSPIRAEEYILAKAGSLSAVSLVVAAVLTLAAGERSLFPVLSGTFLASVIFTLLGIIAATKIISLNQFVLWMVPIEIVCFVPALLHLFKITPAWLRYCPVNVCMDMISGHAPDAAGLLSIMTLTAVLFVLSEFFVRKMWDGMGGVKL